MATTVTCDQCGGKAKHVMATKGAEPNSGSRATGTIVHTVHSTDVCGEDACLAAALRVALTDGVKKVKTKHYVLRSIELWPR